MSHSPVRARARRFASLLAAVVLGAAAQSAVAATYTAADSASFQSLLTTTAQLGDTIVLNAGTTYTGLFTFPDKGAGTNYITIQSSAMGSLPPAGERVKRAYPNAADPDHSVHMPKIRAPGSNVRAIKFNPSSHHYKLLGLEIIGPSNDSALTALLDVGTTGTAQDTDAEIPHHLIFDRCIVRANSGAQALRRGFALHSNSTDIINCHIEGFKDVGSGDSQGIGGVNGWGPYNITNNFIEAASENILFGGSPVSVPNLIPSDIVVTKNHFYKPMSWRGGSPNWNVKNHFELKSGVRVTVDGNIFENSWQAVDQKGKSITFKTVRQSDQGNPWIEVKDVTFTNNIIRSCGIGLSLGGSTAYPSGSLLGHPYNITVRNNLWYDINTSWTGSPGTFMSVQSGVANITIDRNTAFTVNRVMDVGPTGVTYPGWVYINNINHLGADGYAFKGDATGSTSELAFDTYFPSLNFRKNVVMGASSSSFLPNYHGDWGLAPYNNTALAFPPNWTGVLVNQGTPGANFAGWKATGTYATAAVDSAGVTLNPAKPIGADIDAINAATAGCISGVWSSPPVTVTFKNGVNGYSGAICFQASGGSPTTYGGPSSYHRDSNRHAATSQYVIRSFYKFDLSSIPAGKTIDSATLKIKTENTPLAGTTLNAYRVMPVNNAFSVNYNAATRNSPQGNATTWTGGLNAGGMVADANNDFLDTPDDAEPVSAPAVYNLDVKSSVQAWVNGTPNNGWIIMPNPSGTNTVVYMGSTADLHGSADFPELVVIYH